MEGALGSVTRASRTAPHKLVLLQPLKGGSMRNRSFLLVHGGLLLLCCCGGGSSPPPPPPNLQLSPASLSFGVEVVGTTSSPQVETLTNTGGSELVINGVAVAGTSATDFDEKDTCGSGLGAGESCSINVTF